TIFQATYLEAAGAQQGDRLEGEDAIGAAAIGDDLARLWNLAKPTRQISERDVNRPRQMAGGVFVGRANVEHGYETVLQAPREFLSRDRLQFIQFLEVAGD